MNWPGHGDPGRKFPRARLKLPKGGDFDDEPAHLSEAKNTLDEPAHLSEAKTTLDEPAHLSEAKTTLDEPAHLSEAKTTLDELAHLSEAKPRLDPSRPAGDVNTGGGNGAPLYFRHR